MQFINRAGWQGHAVQKDEQSSSRFELSYHLLRVLTSQCGVARFCVLMRRETYRRFDLDVATVGGMLALTE